MGIKPLSVWIGYDGSFWKPAFAAQGMEFVMNPYTNSHPAVVGVYQKSAVRAGRLPIVLSTRSRKALKFYHEHFVHDGLSEKDLASSTQSYFVAVPKRTQPMEKSGNEASNGVIFDGCFLFVPLRLFGNPDAGLMPFRGARRFSDNEREEFEDWIDQVINNQKSRVHPLEDRNVKKR